MIRIERITTQRLETYRTIRLAALADTPLAFGSTYAAEHAFDEARWRDRIAKSTGNTGALYLAFDEDRAIGLAGAYVFEDPTRAMLVSMWVAPSHRRLGTGKQLVEACISWCRQQHLHALDLQVTDWNTGAIRFYERLGFAMTGHTVPYPNDARYIEHGMSLKL